MRAVSSPDTSAYRESLCYTGLKDHHPRNVFTIPWEGSHLLVHHKFAFWCFALAVVLVMAYRPSTAIGLSSNGIGLQAEYFQGTNFDTLKLTRIDPTVNFRWDAAGPDPNVGLNDISARWTGWVVPAYSETYTFYVACDDGQRLWVNGQALVDDWNIHGVTECSGTIALTAGRKYTIKMEFFQGGGPGGAYLSWSSPSLKKEIIPQNRLFPPYMRGTGSVFFDDNEVLPKSAIYVLDTAGKVTKLTDLSSGEPAPSPYGNPVAFTSGRHAVWTDPKTVKNTEIYVMNSDGTNQRRITRNTAGDATPCLSGDGKKIAFSSNRDGNWEIYQMNIDGSFQKRLTADPATDTRPTFSPDGKQIAFQSNRNGQWDIYLLNLAEMTETRLTDRGGEKPVFSPDGTKIAFTSNRDGRNEIYLMKVDGSEQTRLTNSPAAKRSPEFGANGNELLFASSTDGKAFHLCMISLNGTDEKAVANDVNPVNFAWVP